MNNYFVILAAGKSKRFHKKLPKQFFNYRNKEIIEHSIEKSLSSKLFKKILIVSSNLKYLSAFKNILPLKYDTLILSFLINCGKYGFLKFNSLNYSQN